MLKHNKIFILVFIAFFIIQSSSMPALANPDKQDKTMELEAKIKSADDTDVFLYENDSDLSQVLLTLKTNDRVIVLNTSEKFSFVEFAEKEMKEPVYGYVYNHVLEYIEPDVDENTTTQSKANDYRNNDGKSATDESKRNFESEISEFEQENFKHPSASNRKSNSVTVKNQTLLEGVALQGPTYVYESTSTNSKKLKSYSSGSILKYYDSTSDWYRTGVYINGVKQTGYIRKSDVDTSTESPKLLEGVALKNPTGVYLRASKDSIRRKVYPTGSILKYYTYTKDWYRTGVFINGVKQTGYIHKSDVDTSTESPKLLEGVALKNPTGVYLRASKDSIRRKVYPTGSILKYYTYTKDWYRTGVFINGVKQTGYIHKSDVDTATENPKFLEGIAIKSPTAVYTRASTSSKALKTYSAGSILKYYTYTKDWYRTGVYINGVKQTGYIHKSHVGKPGEPKYTYYNLSLADALSIQLESSPQTDNKYAYVSKEYVRNGRVSASSLNVRAEPSTRKGSNSVIGKLPQGVSVNVLGEDYSGWYTIEYQPGGQWRQARPSDVHYYLNPNNFLNDNRQKFQFLDLTMPSGVSAVTLNSYLKGKGTLANQGQAFIDAGRQHGINDVYLISHATLETGNGNSTLAKGVRYNGVTVYNMFGIGAYDSCPVDCGAKKAYDEGWTTPYKAIVGGARFIGNSYVKAGQNTLYKMRWNPEAMESEGRIGRQYATDIGWASKQISTMYNLYQEIGDYTLHLDIPVYK